MTTPIELGKLMNPNRNSKYETDGGWQLGGEVKINTRNGANTSVLRNEVLLQLKSRGRLAS